MRVGGPVVLLLILQLVSCSPYGRDVREALRYAGDNREELESVIRYYSRDKADSLKRKAALFLIGNMTWHRSYPAEAYAEYCHKIDSLNLAVEDDSTLAAAMEAMSLRYAPELEPVYDVRTITADYLIRNIDYSFSVWENTDWLQHLDFSQFCEYVLPYKCVDLQPLTLWKEEYADIYRGELDWMAPVSEYRFNARMAAEAVQERIKDSVKMKRIPVGYTDVLDIRTLVTPGMPVRNHEYDTPEHICDGDPLTYFAVVRDDRWVGFDFGRPVSMGEVAYIRRGDGNDICPGQVYELYYWDEGRWVLHDRQTASRVYLDFKDVPAGALYYIKCITTGEQNRIFFYENGEQIWY